MPIGLRNDADGKTEFFDDPADDRNAEGRVIHIRIARHVYKIKLTDSHRVHFPTRNGKKSRIKRIVHQKSSGTPPSDIAVPGFSARIFASIHSSFVIRTFRGLLPW